jgi:Domain of unknown function (DUF397)
MTDPNHLRDAAWRTSSHSTSRNQCVEVAPLPSGQVAVRDSKNRGAGTHIFSRHAWATFTAGIKNGQFDLTNG